MKPTLSHLDADGAPRMVDVAGKAVTKRRAVVEGRLELQPAHLAALEDNPKGNVLVTAQIAGIQAGKRCAELVPLCHSIALSSLNVFLEVKGQAIHIRAVAEAENVTGVEMEAYTAAAIAAVTLIDMLKGADPDLTLTDLRLVEKTGGKTAYKRDDR